MKRILGIKFYTLEQILDFLHGCLINLFVLSVYILIAIGLMKVVNSLVDKMFVRLLNVRKDHEYKKQVATIKNLVKSIANGVVVVIIVLNFLARYVLVILLLLIISTVLLKKLRLKWL